MASSVHPGSSRRLSGPSRRLTYLATSAALGSALAVSGFIVGTASSDIEAAISTSEAPAAVRTIPVGPATPRAAETTQFAREFPAELLIAPKSIDSLLVPPGRAAHPGVAAKPEVPERAELTASAADARFVAPAPSAAPKASGPVPAPRKRAAEPRRPDTPSMQVARIKHALRLTPDQERYWPPVEAALREIVAEMAREGHGHAEAGRRPQAAAPPIDQAQVQRLTSAAMPLLMTFDEAQKREVRRIARNMGLENVASAI